MKSRANAELVNPEGVVANLQRMSTEDGPGIRTTVFFKGCSLACTWCHNPECLSVEPQLVWHGVRCISCGICASVCTAEALSARPGDVAIDREGCTGCGSCVEACPTTAMEMIGQHWQVEALLAEVKKDYVYFARSGGGVTVSGGEPVLQSRFVERFLAGCRAARIHTALDTCGQCSSTALIRLVKLADLVLFDLKEINQDLHIRFTGKSNRRILDNLRLLRDEVRLSQDRLRLWIRTPIIPGATATVENIEGIGRFIASELGEEVSRWELCAFNNLCHDKYHRLGLNWEFGSCQLLSKDELSRFERVAKGSGVRPEIVLATGATRVEASGQVAEPKTAAGG